MMPTPVLLLDDLLAPIRPNNPAGDDLRSTADWNKIREARPNPYDQGDKGIWTKKNSADVGWPQLFEKASIALRDKSKDLQIAIWLLEASARLYGFAGLRDGLKLIRELLLQFWDSGLFPPIEDGDSEMRSGPLLWLNEKLGELILELPVTARNDGGTDYSYGYLLESRSPNASITAAQFDEAVRSTPLASYETLSEDCRQARDEMGLFESVTDQKFGHELVSFPESKEALEKCHDFLENAVRQKRRNQSTGTSGSTPSSGDAASGDTNGSVGASTTLGLTQNASDGSWDKAEKLVRSGRISEGLREMTELAATEPNGRVRFHRKLLLADICLSTQRDRLAKSILEELAELIDKHRLEEWETPQVVGAVWSRLYRCCNNEKAGIADPDQAAKLFLRLCRLDPWQALSCSEVNRSA